jgi:aminoglycoside 6'-N-acetyltransferase
MTAIALRPLRRVDFPLLAAWLAQPHVARWWDHDTTPEGVERDFGAVVDGADPAEVFVASADGRPFGLVQRYTFADNPGYRDELATLVEVPEHALSMDYFVGPAELLRRGLATALLRTTLASTWAAWPQATAVIVPVVAANEASCRLLARAGLREVARGPLTPDNPIDDPLHVVWRIDRP